LVLTIDIERTYGGSKKPLAYRAPLQTHDELDVVVADSITPSATEGISPAPATLTTGETDTEPELPELRDDASEPTTFRSVSTDSPPKGRARAVSMHDLTHRYFRQPVVVLWRLDMFRANDFALIVLILYALSTLVSALPPRLALTAHVLHALGWRLFHSYGLGLLLRAQSKSKWLVRHYLKHYHYPGDGVDADEGVVKRATEEAFGNWQVVYNISLVMTYGE
jgi:phosphatidylethanolamine N-methyltransferase